MNEQLDKALCEKYPEIFRDRHAPMNQTCMCWGFACGDGWYPLIDQLCKHLMWRVVEARKDLRSHEQAQQFPEKLSKWGQSYYTPERLREAQEKLATLEANIPVAIQVKEKFGTLRFYVNNATDEQFEAISFAESLSSRICEMCGAMKDAQTYREGWHRTLCASCAEKDGRVVVRATTHTDAS